MDTMARIKMTIGDLLVQVAMQAARIEELEAQLKEKLDSSEIRGGNGSKSINREAL